MILQLQSCPVVCPDSWSQFEGHCYFLVTDKYELSTCRAVCQAYGEGADLASIHSPGENQFLADMIQHRPVRNGEKVGPGGGELYNGAKQGKYLPFLGYLDCRGDKGGERELQLAGWNHLGLRELGRRLLLLLIINVNTISLLLSALFVLGEPDRKIPSYKGNHECVFIGKNLDDPGKWWDGVCEWSRWSFDCLCKI